MAQIATELISFWIGYIRVCLNGRLTDSLGTVYYTSQKNLRLLAFYLQKIRYEI